jgi:hypothetical protein
MFDIPAFPPGFTVTCARLMQEIAVNAKFSNSGDHGGKSCVEYTAVADCKSQTANAYPIKLTITLQTIRRDKHVVSTL